MPFVPGGPLFAGNPLHGVLERQIEQMREEVRQMGAEMLDHTLDTHVDRLVERYTLDLPILDVDAARTDVFESYVPEHWPLQVNARYGGTMVLGTVYNLEIPYTGHKSFFAVNPGGSLTRPLGFERDGLLVIPYAGGSNLTPEQVNKYHKEQLDLVKDFVDLQHSTTEEFEPTLRSGIMAAVTERMAKHRRDIEMSAAMRFPLKERPGAPKTYVTPSVRRRALPALQQTAKTETHPTLAEDHYKHILSVIEQMTAVMEHSPKAFATMREEDIRFHYLVQLNGHYLGNATGETFNLEGKTDITIRDNAVVLFVAELKFWDGAKSLTDAVDQILGYVSWRDTKAALIMFSRNQDFSTVVARARETILKHPNLKSGPAIESETRSRYLFANRQDKDRDFSLTLLLYNIRTSD